MRPKRLLTHKLSDNSVIELMIICSSKYMVTRGQMQRKYDNHHRLRPSDQSKIDHTQIKKQRNIRQNRMKTE